VLLLPVGTSLLCAFGAYGHLLVACLLAHQHLQSRYLSNLGALYHLLVVHYCCSLTLSCCAFSMFNNASLLCFVFLLLVNTSLLSYVGVHWHLLIMRFCCSSTPCCYVSSMPRYYVFLLFINTFSLCTFSVWGCLLATCFFVHSHV